MDSRLAQWGSNYGLHVLVTDAAVHCPASSCCQTLKLLVAGSSSSRWCLWCAHRCWCCCFCCCCCHSAVGCPPRYPCSRVFGIVLCHGAPASCQVMCQHSARLRAAAFFAHSRCLLKQWNGMASLFMVPRAHCWCCMKPHSSWLTGCRHPHSFQKGNTRSCSSSVSSSSVHQVGGCPGWVLSCLQQLQLVSAMMQLSGS